MTIPSKGYADTLESSRVGMSYESALQLAEMTTERILVQTTKPRLTLRHFAFVAFNGTLMDSTSYQRFDEALGEQPPLVRYIGHHGNESEYAVRERQDLPEVDTAEVRLMTDALLASFKSTYPAGYRVDYDTLVKMTHSLGFFPTIGERQLLFRNLKYTNGIMKMQDGTYVYLT